MAVKAKDAITLTRVNDGAPGKSYSIDVSEQIVKIQKDGFSTDAITINGYTISDKGREAYAGRFVIRECDLQGKWTTVYTSEKDENNITYSLYNIFTVGNGDALLVGYPENASQGGYGILTIPRSNISEIECTLYASGGTVSVLDVQRISFIKDAESLTHEDIFNLLTKNGEIKGIYKEGNELYISFTYAKGGQLVLGGSGNSHGLMEVLDTNGNKIGEFGKDGLNTLGNVSSRSGNNRSELNYGRLHFYKNDTHIGRISTLVGAIDGEGRQADVLSFASYSDGMTFSFGNEDEHFWGAFFNNGFNPNGYTERYIFNGAIRADGWMKANSFRFTSGENEYIDRASVQASSGNWYAIRCNGDGVFVNGRLYVKGEKNRIVDTENHGTVALNAVESPEAIFADYGSGVIAEHGSVSVFFDPVFAETIDADCEYQVFTTQTSKGNIEYVEKKKGYFVVHGECGTAFDWSVVCKQKDYEAVRLEEIYIEDKHEIDFDESIFYQDNAGIGILNDMKEKYEREVDLL